MFVAAIAIRKCMVLLQVEKVCAMLLENKLLYNKFDEVGIVLFGTKGTLSSILCCISVELRCWKHICIVTS
ncbi:unnamed protein product [Amaranthus hypochondriacus]